MDEQLEDKKIPAWQRAKQLAARMAIEFRSHVRAPATQSEHELELELEGGDGDNGEDVDSDSFDDTDDSPFVDYMMIRRRWRREEELAMQKGTQSDPEDSAAQESVQFQLEESPAQLDSEFFIPSDPTPLRIKSLLAQLSQLQLPDDEPLKKFTLFPKLAPEIRNNIWKFVSCQLGATKIAANRGVGPPSLWSSPYPPSILSTSKEARREGLRHYETCIVRTNAWEPEHAPLKKYKKLHFVNFNHHNFIDLLTSNQFQVIEDSAFYPDDMAKIQELTIMQAGYRPGGFYANPPDMLGILSYLPNLQQITVVVRNWCAAVGVNQGIDQELYRKELQDEFETYYQSILKDAGLKPELKIFFRDWNDSDTAPCSADPDKGFGKRYFSPDANANTSSYD
ncbi:hypothetical protein N431DRAFT_447151 [Stipitochalara longipes BDJ]|nr:hypothetical protein N431DRAFT_447151 [Stipitochalara longipes BDJ]